VHKILRLGRDAQYDTLTHDITLSAHAVVGPQDKATCTCEMTIWPRSMHATPYHVPIAVYTFSRITRKEKPNSFASPQWPLKAQGVKIKCNTNVILTEEFVV
jgi:hypothetical protein